MPTTPCDIRCNTVLPTIVGLPTNTSVLAAAVPVSIVTAMVAVDIVFNAAIRLVKSKPISIISAGDLAVNGAGNLMRQLSKLNVLHSVYQYYNENLLNLLYCVDL